MATNKGDFTEASSGAPTLNGVAGSLITLLDWLLDVSNTNGRKVFDKVYTGTNKAVYRATTGNRHYLRVDDSAAQEAQVRVYESMSDVDTGTDEFPLLTTYSAANYVIRKSFEANSNARDWRATVWARGFNLFVKRCLTTSAHDLYCFGEGIREDGVADPYNTFIWCRSGSGTSTAPGTLSGSSSKRAYPIGAISGATLSFARKLDGSTKGVLGAVHMQSASTWAGESYPTTPYLYRARLGLAACANATGSSGEGQYRGHIPYLWGLVSQCAGATGLDIDDVHADTPSGASFVQIASGNTITSSANHMLMETTDTDPLVP